MSGFRTYRRDVLKAIALKEMVVGSYLAGFTIVEVFITFEERRARR